MSWINRGEGETPDEVFDDLERNAPSILPHGASAQIETAGRKAVECLRSGNFGNGPFRVVLSGHTKQGNSDIFGNTLSISIHSKT